jgi:hypothetical protein
MLRREMLVGGMLRRGMIGGWDARERDAGWVGC